MRWAQIVDGVVANVTVSVDESTGADWLTENVGGVWVACGDDVSPGMLFDGSEFSWPELDFETL